MRKLFGAFGRPQMGPLFLINPTIASALGKSRSRGWRHGSCQEFSLFRRLAIALRRQDEPRRPRLPVTKLIMGPKSAQNYRRHRCPHRNTRRSGPFSSAKMEIVHGRSSPPRGIDGCCGHRMLGRRLKPSRILASRCLNRRRNEAPARIQPGQGSMLEDKLPS